MSRAIRLSRIHAINWYGYNDCLPVEGHLLLAGVTGSGKSILMDLVQLVLVGSDRAMFNRSATGSTGDRTLKGYCLLDTKREENGQPQYVRDKGAISYIALEFRWPKGDRVETWGLRIEFRNASENQGRVSPFFCDGSLEKSDFLDGERRTLELPAFRHLVEKKRDGRVFETQEQYLRDMANDRHLNFNRAVLSSLLPSAMSFTNLKSFDEFCRRFILPGDKLNIGDVVASYKNFQAYERDLRELRDQLERLHLIHQLHTTRENAARDKIVARWLAAELAEEHAVGELGELNKTLEGLRAEFAEETNQIKHLDKEIPKRKAEIKQAQAAIFQMPGGADYLALKSRNEMLAREIAQLQEIGTTVESALRARVRNAYTWLEQVRGGQLPAPVGTDVLALAIKKVESCELEKTDAALRGLAATVEEVKAEISRVVRPTREQLEGARGELGKVREEIQMLESGIPPGPRQALNALNDALPREGREPAARQLRDLCEVADEKWRAAVEVAFTRKFAIVVPEEHYAKALKVYHEFKGESSEESLINPAKALKFTKQPRPGSLAEKIRPEHLVAAAIVNQLFGDVQCVERREDLAQHDFAILPDGFITRGAFVERRRHYNNLPFVGKRGLEQQLALKRSVAKDLEIRERQLRPFAEAADVLIRAAAAFFPEHSSLVEDLALARELPKKTEELKENIARLNTIDRAPFEQKQRELQELEGELEKWERQLRDLLGSQKLGAIKSLEKAAKDKQTSLESAGRNFERVKNETGDVSIHIARLKKWRQEIVTELPSLDAAARQFERLEGKAETTAAAAWEQLKAARRELALAYPKFQDLVPEDENNAAWDKLRGQIFEANIPDYQAKSEAARKQWENLFRNQVLSKLDRALRDVRDVVFLLNSHLKSPIGNDRYEVKAIPSPDFKPYRELISLNAQCQQDDLFFASVSAEMKGSLEHFLKILVEQPDSMEAARLLDYRYYYDYDLLVWNARDDSGKPVSVDRQSGKFSGGENQSPYFIAILASYLRAYNRHETRWREPSLAIVPIDEAFSKLSPERIEDCVKALKLLDLQGVLSMSAGNIPFAFSQCDQLIIVSKHEERRGSKPHIRNVPVCIVRESDEGREWMERHA